MQKIIRLFEQFFLQAWWVILFGILCYMVFENSVKMLKDEFSRLQEHYKELERQEKETLILQEKLKLELNSQSDPAWVELVLKKGLGLIPEEQIKVFFDNSTPKTP